MDLSIFLAKLLGLYLLIVAVLWVLRKEQFESSVKDFVDSKGMLAFSGGISIVLGLAIAIGHPIWEWSWKGLISLLGYLFILQGIMRLGFPELVQKNTSKMLGGVGYWIGFAVIAILGIYLTYSGFKE